MLKLIRNVSYLEGRAVVAKRWISLQEANINMKILVKVYVLYDL